MFANFIRRLQEPSTHAGIAGLISLGALFGMPQTIAQAATLAVSSLPAVAAIFLPENKAQ